MTRGELRRRRFDYPHAVEIVPEWLLRKEPTPADVVDSKPLVGGYTMGVDMARKSGDRSILALARAGTWLGFMGLETGSPTQSEAELRTLYTNGDVGGVLTWEQFRRAIEECTGLRFADHVDAQVVDERPLSLPPPTADTTFPPGGAD